MEGHLSKATDFAHFVEDFARGGAKNPRFSGSESHSWEKCLIHSIGLRENLQETMDFTIKYRVFL